MQRQQNEMGARRRWRRRAHIDCTGLGDSKPSARSAAAIRGERAYALNTSSRSWSAARRCFVSVVLFRCCRCFGFVGVRICVWVCVALCCGRRKEPPCSRRLHSASPRLVLLSSHTLPLSSQRPPSIHLYCPRCAPPPLQRTVADLVDRERLGLREVAGRVKGLLLSMLFRSERGRLFDFRIERVGRRSVSRGAARPRRSPSFRCHSRSPGHTHPPPSAHPPSPLPPLLTSDPTSKKKCTLEALSMK